MASADRKTDSTNSDAVDGRKESSMAERQRNVSLLCNYG